jgi:hypothetical protein
VNGKCTKYGKIRNASNILIGKPEQKRPLSTPMRTWESNTKMDLAKIDYDCNWVRKWPNSRPF